MSHDGRFAPSPTGHAAPRQPAHRAARLAVRPLGGARFLVRMEDLDTGRVRPAPRTRQLADLAALGLDWDGEVVRQSERFERYTAALERSRGRARRTSASAPAREIREAASAPHGPLPEGAYPGTCRG